MQYFYGAASRRGAPPMPLQGVWTADDGQPPPGRGDYHHELNTQMTYDAYQTAGRFEEGACFLDHLYGLLPLSSSPEIFDNTLRAFLEPNSNYDRDCLEALFRGLAHMARASGRPEEAEGWTRTAEQLGPRAVEADGTLMFSAGEEVRQSHRHFSQSMSIHPFDLVTVEEPGDRAVIEATLRRYDELGTKWWCGYSFSWMACLRARGGNAVAALAYLDIYRKAFTSRNGFHLNGDQLKAGYSRFQYRPFTLEGNFLAAEAVHEMLLQSWHEVVRIFPATPERWAEASFEDLRAEGGFRVSARREEGATTWVRIQATVDGTVRVLDNFGGRVPEWNRKDLRREGDCFVLDMRSDQILEGRFR